MQPVCAVCGRKIESWSRVYTRDGDPDNWDVMPPAPRLKDGWRPKRIFVCHRQACEWSARKAGYREVPAEERNGYVIVRTAPKQPSAVAS